MQGKKWIAAALVCGFLLGQGTAPAQAGILGTVPMALRRELPAEVKEKVKNFILSYDNAAYYKGVMGAEDKRFVECSIEDYKGIIDLNKALSSSK